MKSNIGQKISDLTGNRNNGKTKGPSAYLSVFVNTAHFRAFA